MTMQAHDDPAFEAVVNAADLVLPDGVPMVWALRALGLPQRRRVRVTPDLLLELIVDLRGARHQLGLYGGTPRDPGRLRRLPRRRGSRPRGRLTPGARPSAPLTPEEDAEVTEKIRAAGVQLLLVGIGCPKQERWMAAHADQLDCVMFGVGAAFDMFAGKTGNAPAWMRDRGLEWVYRLVTEPRRLWRRYLLGQPALLWHFALQLARERRRSEPDFRGAPAAGHHARKRKFGCPGSRLRPGSAGTRPWLVK